MQLSSTSPTKPQQPTLPKFEESSASDKSMSESGLVVESSDTEIIKIVEGNESESSEQTMKVDEELFPLAAAVLKSVSIENSGQD